MLNLPGMLFPVCHSEGLKVVVDLASKLNKTQLNNDKEFSLSLISL
jgi:hypothetical protein